MNRVQRKYNQLTICDGKTTELWRRRGDESAMLNTDQDIQDVYSILGYIEGGHSVSVSSWWCNGIRWIGVAWMFTAEEFQGDINSYIVTIRSAFMLTTSQ